MESTFQKCPPFPTPISGTIPRTFSGKIVRIKYADLHWFMHGYFFLDPACSNDEDLYLTDNGRTSVSFYRANRAQIFHDLKDIQRSDPRIAIEIIADGRFVYERPKTEPHITLRSIQ